MVAARRGLWFSLLVCALMLLKAQGFSVPITYVENGVFCLDGRPPAYHFDKGFGAGINNWLVFIEGGGWCNDVTTCHVRANTGFGSSKKMGEEVNFTGILSNEQKYNPDFYNWNRIEVKYCDGASFTGDLEAVDPATNLHFRGARVFLAVMKDLLMAILSGCSAGGLASILYCDNFRALFPVGTRVKCLADAGYFINVKDISDASHIEEFFAQVVATHGSIKHLPASCTQEVEPRIGKHCFFPQYVAGQVMTPLFIVNSAYDKWQVSTVLLIVIYCCEMILEIAYQTPFLSGL
ncbi:hypothetical protein CICLE_v10030247mg [Citrus x clementina]|uniref:Pectin acetylesterase n=1 Tax=Citrus clementina TaxID=85681 RepID=V4SFW8_CITCL|nr:hypothetical protein CICLE_v10030247mg [Citrus x clementina]